MSFLDWEIFDKLSALELMRFLKEMQGRKIQVNRFNNMSILFLYDIPGIIFGEENVDMRQIDSNNLEPEGFQELNMDSHFETVHAVTYYLEREHFYINITIPGFKELYKKMNIRDFDRLEAIIKEMLSEKAELDEHPGTPDEYFPTDEVFEDAYLLVDNNKEPLGFSFHFIEYNPHDELLLKTIPKIRHYCEQFLELYDVIEELRDRYNIIKGVI